MHCIFDQSRASGNPSDSLDCFVGRGWSVNSSLLQWLFWSLGMQVPICLHMGQPMEPWQYALSRSHLQSLSNWLGIRKKSQVGLTGISSILFFLSGYVHLFARHSFRMSLKVSEKTFFSHMLILWNRIRAGNVVIKCFEDYHMLITDSRHKILYLKAVFPYNLVLRNPLLRSHHGIRSEISILAN